MEEVCGPQGEGTMLKNKPRLIMFHERILVSLGTFRSISEYIYIYMCVCVCVVKQLNDVDMQTSWSFVFKNQTICCEFAE